MKIENNRYASLTYTLHENNREGRVIETVEEAAPMGFVFGAGRLLPAFEANIAGLEEGSAFDFSLLAADAYGEVREEMVISLPRNIFEDEGVLRSEICYVGNKEPLHWQWSVMKCLIQIIKSLSNPYRIRIRGVNNKFQIF